MKGIKQEVKLLIGYMLVLYGAQWFVPYSFGDWQWWLSFIPITIGFLMVENYGKERFAWRE